MLIKIHLGLLAAITTMAAPLDSSCGSDSAGSQSKCCVNGGPTKYGTWTIDYHRMNLPSDATAQGLVVEPGWAKAHESLGDVEVGPLHCKMHGVPNNIRQQSFAVGSSWYEWTENKCQFTCNARTDCVSWVSYECGFLYVTFVFHKKLTDLCPSNEFYGDRRRDGLPFL